MQKEGGVGYVAGSNVNWAGENHQHLREVAKWAKLLMGKLWAYARVEGITLQIVKGMVVNRWVCRATANIPDEEGIERVSRSVARVYRSYSACHG